MWSILALALYQGMLQFVVNPSINKCLGAEKFGNVLYIVAVISILAPAVGTAVGNVRLMREKNEAAQNGDFLLPLGVQTALVATVFILLCRNYVNGAIQWLLLIMVLGLTAARSYGEAGYRISLDYRGYFFYYSLLSAGQLLGVSFLFITGNWIFCFVIGELFCVVLAVMRGNFFLPLSLTKRWKEINRQSIVLMAAYLFNNSIGFLDRILLQQWMNSTAVSVYYVSSLLGKIIIMLVIPLNNVLFSYLAKQEERITSKRFTVVAFGMVGIGGILYAGVMIVSPIFLNLLYADLYEPAFRVLWMVSLSQIFCAVTATLMTILLKTCGVKWQLRFQMFYFVQYILLSYIGVKQNGLRGFAVGGMMSNILQLTLVFGLGLILVKRTPDEGREH